MRAKGVFVIGLPAHGALQKIEKATAARDVPWRSLDVPQSSNDGRGYRRRGCSNLTPSPDLARILETDRARPQHFVHRVARHLQLANDLLDRLPFDKCAPDPPNRLHNQHPPATHSRSPSGQPVQLIADGVKVGRRSPLYWGESSTPKHTLIRRPVLVEDIEKNELLDAANAGASGHAAILGILVDTPQMSTNRWRRSETAPVAPDRCPTIRRPRPAAPCAV